MEDIKNVNDFDGLSLEELQALREELVGNSKSDSDLDSYLDARVDGILQTI